MLILSLSLFTTEILDLSINGFTGNIWNNIGDMLILSELRLADNSLNGNIPNSMGNMVSWRQRLGWRHPCGHLRFDELVSSRAQR
jgi:hypothetical protein